MTKCSVRFEIRRLACDGDAEAAAVPFLNDSLARLRLADSGWLGKFFKSVVGIEAA